ncbi:bifunctional phosphoribosyl-AMP cyclohydrolase /phosphoribosyl-ATP pyrophosphatase protein [Actinobacillus pleuropneumoniae]|nr:bifunctional phosphoribosyl-AMP cyclohydrolase /phosphoribosyl-ATP pyrophosphatase protein [Actinobacillus pleuropneumoniae]
MSEDMLKDFSLEQVSEHIRWDAAGLVPAIVQDAQSKQVLMMAYMNRESLRLTLGKRRDLVLEPFARRAVA